MKGLLATISLVFLAGCHDKLVVGERVMVECASDTDCALLRPDAGRSITGGARDRCSLELSGGKRYCVSPARFDELSAPNTTAVVAGACADTRLTANEAGACVPSFTTLAAGDDTTCGLLGAAAGEAGSLYCWGAAAANVTGWYRAGGTRPHLDRIAARGNVLCGLDALDASLQCWNLAYAQGNGLVADDARKVAFADLSMADDHVCGLTTTGTAICLPTAPDAVVPAPLPTPPKWKALASGVPDDCGLDELGNIACWPGRPAELLAAAADSLVRSSTAGCLLTAGALQCWAESEMGKTLAQNVTPESGATFATVAVGQELVCALPQDPAKPPACWSSAATTVPEVAGLESLAVGKAHACALNAGGSAVCWGINDAGQAPRVYPPEP